MKIILATPQDKTALGVTGGYCERALKALGHEVAVFDFRKRPYAQNKVISGMRSLIRPVFSAAPSLYDVPAVHAAVDKGLNRALVEKARVFRPDLLLVLLGENIAAESVSEIGRLGAVTANWLFDSLILPHRLDFMRRIAPAYDHIFLIDSPEVLRAADLQVRNIASILLGCDPSVHNRMVLSGAERERYGSAVAFIGTVTPEREKILEKLRGFDLKIWGRWQRKNPLLARAYRDKDLYESDAVKIFNAARIIIDIHGQYASGGNLYNVTPRVFEVPSSGGFLLTNDIPQLHGLYRVGEEIAVYKDGDDLKKLVEYYLAHGPEREKIAQAGYNRAHSEHTYAKRLETLIRTVRKR